MKYVLTIMMALGLAVNSASAEDIQSLQLYPTIDFNSGIAMAHNGEAHSSEGGTNNAASGSEEPFVEPMMTWDKFHGYVGAGSFLAAILAGATAPDNENPALRGQPIKKGFHHYAGLSAAALGGAAVMSGLLLHLDDIEPDFLDPDTAHMILGIAATAAYAYAVSKGPKKYGMGSGSHAAAGIGGAALMATALYIEF